MTSKALARVYQLLADGKLWSQGDLMRGIPGSDYSDIQLALEEDEGQFIRKFEVAHRIKQGPKYYYSMNKKGLKNEQWQR